MLKSGFTSEDSGLFEIFSSPDNFTVMSLIIYVQGLTLRLMQFKLSGVFLG